MKASDFKRLRRSMWPESEVLLPVSRRMPSLARPRRIAQRLALGLLLFAGFAAVAPWQQNLGGSGSIIALSPDERPQPLQATISGRIARWHVTEGQQVAEGDLIAELVDNDPDRLRRLQSRLEAAIQRRDAYRARQDAYEERIDAILRSQRAQVLAAEAERDIAQQSLDAKREMLAAANASQSTARAQSNRIEGLATEGLASTRDRELADLASATADATIAARNAEVRAAEASLASKRASLTRAIAQAEADLQDATASLDSARTDVASADAAVLDAEHALAAQDAQDLRAPRDGVVQRISTQSGTAQISRGDTLAYLVPRTASRAAALFVDGNDAALITPGRRVRLQFEGWPAVQFSGWPSVAVGTFGGTVAFVDPSDDGTGDFRVVVVPDEDEEAWPDSRFLRQGTRAKGWVLLEEVSIGFELWRQVNGFPPAFEHEPGTYP